ncbi:MAG: TolC family protein [Alphaproteobacteria bacterium]|nr:TolC family protein [Alphaproteobacteria bacterium]
MLRLLIACALLGTGLISAPTVRADEPPGARLAPLLALARAQNPRLAAARLASDAALARTQQADSLADPTFKLEFEGLDRRNGPLPATAGERTYFLEQHIPLGPKLRLRREVAEGEQQAASAAQAGVNDDLVSRIKSLQAERFLAHESLRLRGELAALLRQIHAVAIQAYEQGRGGQDAVLATELRFDRNETAMLRLGGLRRQQDARLNSLLDRLPGSPLADPAELAGMPEADRLSPATLLATASRLNAEAGRLRALENSAVARRRLADAEWLPDIAFGVGVVERGGAVSAYEATVSINLPLRWGLRQARQRETASALAAREAERRAVEREIAGEITETLAAIASERRVEALLEGASLPRARAMSRNALSAYRQGLGGLAPAVEAELKRVDLEIELLAVRVEQRRLLARIERLIGEDL